jgi:hypothetical protein
MLPAMKRALAPFLAGLLLFGALFTAGCTSVDAQPGGKAVASKKRFFVLSNPNDNHAIDRQIANTLKARGYEGDCGPHTMMPDDTEVIVTYEEHWDWDFGDHLVFLQIDAKDERSGRLYGSAVYRAKIPSGKSVGKIISGLIDRLLADAKK